MALILTEGFDHYGTIADMSSNRWTSVTLGSYVTSPQSTYFVPGRFGGKAATLQGGILTFPSSYTQIFTGFALKGLDTGTQTIYIYSGPNTSGSYTGANAYISINYSSGVVQLYIVTNYLGSTTLVASSAAGVISTGNWNYVEISFKSGTSTGSMEVRVNGTSVVSASSLNMQQNSTSTANFIYLQFSSITAYIDDLYLCDTTVGPGTYPMNTFLGDKRIVTMAPATNSAVTWTPATTWTVSNNPTTSIRSLAVVANRTYLAQYISTSYSYTAPYPTRLDPGTFTATQNSTLQSVNIYGYGATAGVHVKAVIYSESTSVLNTPGALLATSNAITGVANGVNTLTFPTPPTIVKGANYFIGFIADAAFNLQLGVNITYSSNIAYIAATYPTPPSTFDVTTATTIATYSTAFDLTFAATNYGQVSEQANDMGLSYNSTSTLNNQDLFTTDQSVPSTATIYGVQVVGSYAKDDAATRAVANVLKSGATTSVGAPLPLTASYTEKYDVYAVDPNTSASWTAANARSALIGYKVTT